MEEAVWVYLMVQWVISPATAEGGKKEGKREKGVCLRENLYLGLISHAQAEWRIFCCTDLFVRSYLPMEDPGALQEHTHHLDLPSSPLLSSDCTLSPLASLCGKKKQVSILGIKSPFVRGKSHGADFNLNRFIST